MILQVVQLVKIIKMCLFSDVRKIPMYLFGEDMNF